MATRKPLAELRAAYKSARRDCHNLYVTFAIPVPEDWPVADGFFSSEWRSKMIVLGLRPLDNTFVPLKSDPNQPVPETDVDDELARLRRHHQDLLASMTNRNAEPPSEATTA